LNHHPNIANRRSEPNSPSSKQAVAAKSIRRSYGKIQYFPRIAAVPIRWHMRTVDLSAYAVGPNPKTIQTIVDLFAIIFSVCDSQ
jgi:hypothetical protein